jgi:hypothetical protein
VGKGFSLVVGVTAAGGPEGQSPYGNSPTADLGSNPALSVSLCLGGKKPLGSTKAESNRWITEIKK